MRPVLITLLASLLLAAPASAARFQKGVADIDFTVAPTDLVDLTATGDDPGGARQLTFTRGTGATPFTIGPAAPGRLPKRSNLCLPPGAVAAARCA